MIRNTPETEQVHAEQTKWTELKFSSVQVRSGQVSSGQVSSAQLSSAELNWTEPPARSLCAVRATQRNWHFSLFHFCHFLFAVDRFPCNVGPYLTLPYFWGGQVVTPAQRWGCISSAQCATPM